tara:strand:+ start:156 stop:416 length:261 start_codon:yes stop_codon:yes gene_type:complete
MIKMLCYKKSDKGNIRLNSVKGADLISISKEEISEDDMQKLATHFRFAGDVRESESTKSWNVWRESFDEAYPSIEVDLDAILNPTS